MMKIHGTSGDPSQMGFLELIPGSGHQFMGASHHLHIISSSFQPLCFAQRWGYVESYDPQMQRFLVSVVLQLQQGDVGHVVP